MTKRYEAAEIVDIGPAETMILGSVGDPFDNAAGYGDEIPASLVDTDE